MRHIWEGVYRGFGEVPASGDGHSGGVWVSKSLAKIRDLLSSMQRQESNPPVPAYGASLLPVLVALLYERYGRVCVLDFGGGLGTTFVQATAGMPAASAIEYHIVETEAICRAGEQVFRDDARLHFHTTLPSAPQRADIVHLGSSLHYIDDWKGLIRTLAAYEPSYFMLTDLPAGNIPTYVTGQNYYGSKIPARFFNLKEIEEAMAGFSFSLVFRSRFEGTYLGKVQKMPQDNFPPELRLGDTCSLLFHGKGDVPEKSGSIR